MISDQLMRIEIPKTVRRGEEFGVTTWISISKLKEHYYFQDSIKIALRFCYVLRRSGLERMIDLPDKFDLTPFMFEDESEFLEYRASMFVKEEYPLSVNIKDEFSCVYYAYLLISLEHRQLFKKRVFQLDREMEPAPEKFSGSLAEVEFTCQRFCCIGQDTITVLVEKRAPVLRVAREETLRVCLRPSSKALEGSLMLSLVMYFEMAVPNEDNYEIRKILARQVLGFSGEVKIECSFIISTLDFNRADVNKLYRIRYQIEVTKLDLGLCWYYTVENYSHCDIQLT